MDPEYVVRWDGAHRGCNADLFHPPEVKDEDEDDPPAVHVIVPKPSSPPLDVTEHQAEVLAAMGAVWTRPCTIVRRITLSHYAVNRALRMLVRAQQVEMKIMAASSFSRGVRWYRRVR